MLRQCSKLVHTQTIEMTEKLGRSSKLVGSVIFLVRKP